MDVFRGAMCRYLGIWLYYHIATYCDISVYWGLDCHILPKMDVFDMLPKDGCILPKMVGIMICHRIDISMCMCRCGEMSMCQGIVKVIAWSIE